MSGAVSIRTQVRDAFVSALRTIEDSPTARVPGAELLTHYATVEEIKKFPAYCVVVTNEELSVTSQMCADVSLTVLVVLYVKSENDVRAVLDGAIEDVWEALRLGQFLRAASSQLRLDSIETDEGTTIVKPFTQAVMRWTCEVRRSVSW